MLDAALGVASGLVGHFMNKSAAKKQAAANERARQEDYAHQKEFAQSGITWKVEDARRAGIHPAIALGAQPASYSPIGVGDTGTQHLAASGQDLSRAIDSTRTAFSRTSAYEQTVQDLTLQKMGLENEYLASQIAKVKQQVGPPMPGTNYLMDGQTASGAVPPGHDTRNPQFTPKMSIAGMNWNPNPRWTDAQTMEDRYGEITDYIYGPGVVVADYYHNMKRALPYRSFYNKWNRPKNMKGW